MFTNDAEMINFQIDIFMKKQILDDLVKVVELSYRWTTHGLENASPSIGIGGHEGWQEVFLPMPAMNIIEMVRTAIMEGLQ